MSGDLISTTKLAREFGLSNKDCEAKLARLGVEPVAQMEINGRFFRQWDEKDARQKLTESRRPPRAPMGSAGGVIADDLRRLEKKMDMILSMLAQQKPMKK